MEATFSCSLDRTSQIVTAVVWMLPIIIGGLYFYLSSYGRFVRWSLSAALVIVIAIPLLAFALGPRQYVVNESGIVIERIYSDVIVYKSDIVKAKNTSPSDLGRQIRVFGVGGAHGYFGKFHSENYGAVTYYTTRNENLILIERASKNPILLSPDDPREFLKAVNQIFDDSTHSSNFSRD